MASDDRASTSEDVPVVVDVLENDTDPDGDPLSVVQWSDPTLGTVTADGGRLVYTPDPDANGTDRFQYTVADPDGASASAIVVVEVAPVNDPPVGRPDGPYRTKVGGMLVIADLLANDRDVDGDSILIGEVEQPSAGNVTVSKDRTAVTYNHKDAYATNDLFRYRVSDGTTLSDWIVVTIEIG